MILAEIEAESFLEKEGFHTAKKSIVENKSQIVNAAKSLGFPCVLKISSSEATHKAAIGGVKMIYSMEDIDKAWDDFQQNAKKVNGKIFVQKFISGKELLIGLKKDPVFGHVLLVGIGGSFTEIIKDIKFKILLDGIKEPEAISMLKELKNFKMIEKCNLNAISKIMVNVAALSKKFPEIRELDINPLIANEKDALIADARILKN
jgi:succinyl-CoA synthetase beta subunit